jgi:hypothetical protein
MLPTGRRWIRLDRQPRQFAQGPTGVGTFVVLELAGEELDVVVARVVLVVVGELVADRPEVTVVVERPGLDEVPVVCRREPGERLVPGTCVLPLVWMTCLAAPGTACWSRCQRASRSLNTAAPRRSPPSGVKCTPSSARTGMRVPVPSSNDGA